MSFDLVFGVREDYLCGAVEANFEAQFKFFKYNCGLVKGDLILIKAHTKDNTIFLFEMQLFLLPNH